ncbi:hypothetical protein QJQ45_026322 [Haematococcus lacustris]|nr:hypothetical protein QJQ45_026322 [Haematococcus lacustris]
MRGPDPTQGTLRFDLRPTYGRTPLSPRLQRATMFTVRGNGGRSIHHNIMLPRAAFWARAPWASTLFRDAPGLACSAQVQHLSFSGSHEFSNAREGLQSPLAKRLFAIDGVTSVFLGADFITITKKARPAGRQGSGAAGQQGQQGSGGSGAAGAAGQRGQQGSGGSRAAGAAGQRGQQLGLDVEPGPDPGPALNLAALWPWPCLVCRPRLPCLPARAQADESWSVLKPLAFAAIMDHFASGEPLFTDAATLARSDTAIHEDDDEVVAMIKELLETRIRPAVMEDGGDITYKSFDPDTGVVTVKMLGACSGCPSSTVTLKSGIENMLMHYIPEVKGVIEAGPDEGEEEGLKELRRLEAALGEEAGDDEEGDAGGIKLPPDSPLAQHLSN